MDSRAQKAIEKMQNLAFYYRAQARAAKSMPNRRLWAGRASEIEWCMQIVEEEFAELHGEIRRAG